MTQVFVTRRIPNAGLRLLEGRATVAVGQTDGERGLDRAALFRGVREADVLLSLLTERVDRELLEANPGLLGVANYAVGFDNVDVATATDLGIPVSNTPGVLTEATADLTWALLLTVARRIVESDAYVRAGRFNIWSPNLLLGADVGAGPDGLKARYWGSWASGGSGRRWRAERAASTWMCSRTTRPTETGWRLFQGYAGQISTRYLLPLTSCVSTPGYPPTPGT